MKSKKQKRVPSTKKRIPPRSQRESAPKPQHFKPGNKLWQMRGSGRKTTYTPEELWNEFVAYTDWCDSNPWIEEDWRGSGDTLEKVEIKHQTPYSLDGFQIWCDMSDEFLSSLDSAKSYDFSRTLTSIRKVCKTQQIEGAMTGFFNGNIVQRVNGLAENVNTNINAKVSNAFPTEDELNNHTT